MRVDSRDFEHGHDPVQQTTNDLKPGGLVAPDSASVSNVPGLSLRREILDSDVRGLKDFNRKCVLSVLPDGLQQTREKRRPDDLIFSSLGVR